MAAWFFLLSLILSLGSNSTAQTYKYVNKDGAICFTETPTASHPQTSSSPKENTPKPRVREAANTRPEIKDIFQMAQEMLDEELAKPPKKQNQKLIHELREVLYGDLPGKTVK